jgi:hypothetical protein
MKYLNPTSNHKLLKGKLYMRKFWKNNCITLYNPVFGQSNIVHNGILLILVVMLFGPSSFIPIN